MTAEITTDKSKLVSYRYGRMLSDFNIGETYLHPWEVTLDDGMLALYAASFQEAMPVHASDAFARALGFAGRPVHPLLCMNLALSFSVHDVSEQAIAHLAYVDVIFPNAAYVGDTVSASSTVIESKPSSAGDKGVVHVRTVLSTETGKVVCAFERKALIRAGKLEQRPAVAEATLGTPNQDLKTMSAMPAELRDRKLSHFKRPIRFHGCFEDFSVGAVYAHGIGKTVGDSEHMQLTTLMRNSHPLHFDELYCKQHSFTDKRVVYGGLVFAWTAALASRDVAGNALWEIAYAGGAHPASVAAGDTLYAASKVLAVEEQDGAGVVTFALVGVKNITSEAALEKYGDALFAPELVKKEGKIPEKVFEIRRMLLIRKRV